MNAEQIEEAALEWFWKRDRGQSEGSWTASDQIALEEWLNRATANRVAYLRCRAAWRGAERMTALAGGTAPGVVPAPGSWGNDRFLGGASGQRRANAEVVVAASNSGVSAAPSFVAPPGVNVPSGARRRVTRWAAAAALAFALVAGGYILETWRFNGHYSTPVGGLEKIRLDDGSRVTLNTNTHIRVNFSESERGVDLQEGEAFFEVAKDHRRPFIVRVKDKRVVAVGTQFSVRREHDDVRVTVVEGQVRLEQRSVSAPVPTSLPAGAIAMTSHAQVMVRSAALPETERMLSWRTGYLVFEATPLADAVAEMNRYSRRHLVIEDPKIAAFRIGGSFRAGNTEAFLWLLQSGFGVKVEQRDDEVVLSAK